MKEVLKWWQSLGTMERYRLMKKHEVKAVTDKLILLIYKSEKKDENRELHMRHI